MLMIKFKENFGFSSLNCFTIRSICRWLLISGISLSFIFMVFFKNSNYPVPELLFPIKPKMVAQQSTQSNFNDSPTNLSHLVFGLLGSEQAWHHRKAYIESWWRPKAIRGYLYLDKAPTRWWQLPWSLASPPLRVSDNLTRFIEENNPVAPVMIRMVHGIMEVFREEHGNLRWLVMGDDDSIFFLDNIVDVVSKYDHTKYYYFGGQSEYILSNYWYSFNQGFGGAGFILSYSLARALAKDMENCLRRYAHHNSADLITMECIADIGVNLTPHKGIHQIDLNGDISGFLSSHPQTPLLSLHHFDLVNPIFPFMDRFQSAKHLMKAANSDQSRILQQTICYHKQSNHSFSIAWGYSIHVYEKIMPRSILQKPIETFQPWTTNPNLPRYMFNTRQLSNHPCEAPHVFYFKSIMKIKLNNIGDGDYIRIVYSRALPRGLPPCSSNANQSADSLSTIEVFSPATKRVENGRCECCDIIQRGSNKAKVKFRQCMTDEVIA